MGLSVDEIKKQIILELKDKSVFTLVFGSLLTPQFLDESDVDIAIYVKNLSAFSLLDQISALQDSLGRKVDLVILNHADLIIIHQILASGELLDCSNHNLFIKFKAQKLNEYIDFKQFRAPIEVSMKKAILKNG